MASENLEQIVHLARMEDFEADMLTDFMARRKVKAIIVGGGSPYQGNSSLNRQRKGLEDERTWQPRFLQKIRQDVSDAFPETPVLAFLENVASMTQEVRALYDSMLGAGPLFADAGKFGSVQRRRFF